MAKSKQYTKEETQKNVLEHSQAKLDFYKNYLWHYLTVLLQDKYTSKVNIYDVFCGTGIYENGGKGSPIIAMDAINAMITKYPDKNISLTINDINETKVNSAKTYIESNYGHISNLLDVYNLDASNMLTLVIDKIKQTKSREKNLIFIDPYGYKEIYKKDILSIMQAGKSEIILFLPISNMYRFSKVALIDEENASFRHLQRFIEDFFEDKSHPIYDGNFEHQLEYIDFIKDALSFQESYYSACYTIQRDTKNYYALFFLTSHLYGLEKILETKWLLDSTSGEGFEQGKEPTLFDEINQSNRKESCLLKFEFILNQMLAEYKTNCEIYKIGLKNGFLPKHVNKILEKNREKLIFDRDIKLKKESFLIGHKYMKINDIRYRVKIK